MENLTKVHCDSRRRDLCGRRHRIMLHTEEWLVKREDLTLNRVSRRFSFAMYYGTPIYKNLSSDSFLLFVVDSDGRMSCKRNWPKSMVMRHGEEYGYMVR